MICLVTGPNDSQRLVRGKSNKAAIDFVVGESFKSKAVSAEELVDLLAQGLKVEDIPDEEDDKVVTAEEDKSTGNADDNLPVREEKASGEAFNG